MSTATKLPYTRIRFAVGLLVVPQIITVFLTIPVPKPFAGIILAEVAYVLCPLGAALLLTLTGRGKPKWPAIGNALLIWLVFLVGSLFVSVIVFFIFLALAR